MCNYKIQFESIPIVVDQNRLRERKKRTKKREDHSDGDDQTMSSDDDDDHRESGTGILEFSPDKAGMDITPANYNFTQSQPHRDKRHSGTLAGIAGNLWRYFSCQERLRENLFVKKGVIWEDLHEQA